MTGRLRLLWLAMLIGVSGCGQGNREIRADRETKASLTRMANEEATGETIP